MRYQGRVADWNDEKGFGFVMPNGGGKKAFVHIKAFSNRRRRPVEGDLINYELAMDLQGRLRANNIKFSGSPTTSSARLGRRSVAATVALLFYCFVAAATVAGRLPWIVPLFYTVAGVGTFMAYAIDKNAAREHRWRTRERTLHLLGVLGGWPGALLAQKRFHHK